MTPIEPQHVLTKLANYLNAPIGKITKKDNLYTRVNNNQSTTGIINIVFSLLKESNSHLGVVDALNEAQIHQWLEYALVYVANASNSSNVQLVLKELNTILATKTYLVGTQLTIADVFLYYLLLNIMNNLSNLDKETYLNVSRWFDNIQQDRKLSQKNKLVDFSTIYLANFVPARH
ncbi:eukaryotic translation elongation factor 1 epsilon-1 isoform X1 [Dendroctonus ponderosae]